MNDVYKINRFSKKVGSKNSNRHYIYLELLPDWNPPNLSLKLEALWSTSEGARWTSEPGPETVEVFLSFSCTGFKVKVVKLIYSELRPFCPWMK